MDVTFWGVRGSIPSPGINTVKYGGNTPCLEIRLPDINRILIIDAGSGIRELGNFIMANDFPQNPIKADIFITHTHWDHILGFPFFTPIYIPGTELNVYGPVSIEEDSLEKIIGNQLSYHYFPVRREELSADIRFYELKSGEYDFDDGLVVKTTFLNHPTLCLGYRFEYKGKTVCTVYDTEPFRNLFVADGVDVEETLALEGERAAEMENRRIEAFYRGADLVVYDAQYTREEYDGSKIGWGHSAMEYAVESVLENNVKRLALFHHDPVRKDEELDGIYEKLDQFYASDDTEFFFAREGMTVSI